MRGKNTKLLRNKSVRFLAAAALTAAMLGAQMPAAFAADSYAAAEIKRMIPDNITVEDPVKLEDVKLPESKFGTLKWKDDSVELTEHVQSCQVLLIPGEGVDLTGYPEWNEEEKALVSHIHVIVNSIEGNDYEGDCGGEDSCGQDDREEENFAELNTEGEIEETEDTGESAGTKDGAVETEPVEGEMTEETSSERNDSTEESGNSKQEEEAGRTESEKEGSSEMPEYAGEMTEETAEPEVPENTETSSGSEEEQKPEETPETAPDTVPEETTEPSEKPDEEEEDNIFDNPSETQDEERPTEAPEGLTEEEQLYQAQLNHTDNGISVSGINLPWYVQFRAVSCENYEFTNETDAMIFQSYEFELWDLQNHTEYEIPDGEYISVTVPVKEGYDYTVEHLLDNGATETIIPSVEGNIMVFSTHSFSPFGIAGSKQLVGPDFPIEDITPTPSPKPTVTITPGAGGNENGSADNGTETNGSGSTGSGTGNGGNEGSGAVNHNGGSGGTGSGSAGSTGNDGTGGTNSSNVSGGTGTNGNETGTGNGTGGNISDNSSSAGQSYNNGKVVNTGDTTAIIPFISLFAAALLIIAAVLIVKNRKK